MKAVVLRSLGAPEVLRLDEYPDPKASKGHVLIRLKAAALNHRDVWIRTGLYANISLPIILGSDGSGEVIETGEDVNASLKGQAVVIYPAFNWGDNPDAPGPDFKILGLPDPGTYSEQISVPASHVFPKPVGLSFEQAASIPLAALTAFRALVTRARVRPGETVLVTGIGGGVATFILQIAVKLGARVLVTSGSDEKLARAIALGAAGGANYRHQGWDKEIRRLNDNSGPDIVIDSAGGETFDTAIQLVRSGGRVVTYGATTGPAKLLEIRRIFWKQLSILGSTMGTSKEFAHVLELIASRGIQPVVDSVLPLSDVAEAHRRMEQGEQFGKLVLKIEW